jgi:hypothetical protein
MLTYNEAGEMLKKARHGRRKLENNTWLEERHPQGASAYCAKCRAVYDPADLRWTYPGSSIKHDCGEVLAMDYAIRLHNTDVVTLHPDGCYTLDSGGWRTVTTKDRINRYAPVSVASDRGQWYVYPEPGNWDRRHPFADGMRVIPEIRHGASFLDYRIKGAGFDESAIRRQLLKEIRTYIDGFAAHVAKNGLADPGPGDCWGCCMVPTDRATKNKPPGADHAIGVDHIFEHFREKYYVPSLAWRAVQRRGNPAFCYQMAQSDARRGDTGILKDDLRAYFKKLMPALVAARIAETAHGKVA